MSATSVTMTTEPFLVRAGRSVARRWPAALGLGRQWLHAVQLGFRHPGTGEPVVYRSTYPDDLQHALDVLRAA